VTSLRDERIKNIKNIYMQYHKLIIVYHLPTNAKKCLLGHFQKNTIVTLLLDTEGNPFFVNFCQFMRNAFLGKVSLYQSKIIFPFKVIGKSEISPVPV